MKAKTTLIQGTLDLDRRDTGEYTQPGITPSMTFEGLFPTEEANQLAKLESFNKHLFRPNTYLHKWWARRSGTTFRHILKQLCVDPTKRDYYVAGGLEGKIILDPMIGGGTTLHEAIRLGASVAGFDIDPIPVLQARASLSYLPLVEKEAIFAGFMDQLRNRLQPFFVTRCPKCEKVCESQFILYGQRRQCACSNEAVLVDSFLLREEPNGNSVRLCPITGIPYIGDPPSAPGCRDQRIFEKTVKHCPECNKPLLELMRQTYRDRYIPLIVAGYCDAHGQFFKPVDEDDQGTIQRASDYVQRHIQFPEYRLAVHHGPKSRDLLNRGITSFTEVFTARQLVYLSACQELLATVDPRHRLWLGLLVSTSLEFNSLLCGYKGADKRRAGAIRHVFSHHAYSFPYTALENNPVFNGNTSGTLGLLFEDRIRAAAAWADAPIERKRIDGGWRKVTIGEELDYGVPAQSFTELCKYPRSFLVAQQDSSRLPLPDDSVDHIVTDPPYYDSVQYSDLAHFFRAWLSLLLPGEANWEYETTKSAVAETAKDGLKYQKVLTAIWSECHRVLKKPEGCLVFTFHHWRPEAWIYLTLSLKAAGFRLASAFTVQSENPISVHIRQLNALKHDSILVLRPAATYGNAKYKIPGRVDTTSSYEFCENCASALGYCLESDLGDENIIAAWQNTLGT